MANLESAAYDDAGQLVARIRGWGAELGFQSIGISDIDLAANLKKTMFNFAAHRRPEHYRLIVERVGAEVTPAKPGT